MSAAGIARQLGATRQGNNWRCACPRGCGYGLSFRDGAGGRLLAFCFGGCAFDDIMSALVEYGLLDDNDDDDLHVSRGVTVCRRGNTERIAHAWIEEVPDAGHWPWMDSPGVIRNALDRLVHGAGHD